MGDGTVPGWSARRGMRLPGGSMMFACLFSDGRRAALAAAVTVVLGAVAGMAAGAPVTAAPAVGAPARPVPRPGNAPDAAAQALAMSGHRTVTVDADLTAYSDTVANPDGSFTLTSHIQPQRARQAGRWVPVNATLVRSAA